MLRPLPCLALLSLCVFGVSALADEKEEAAKKAETEKKEAAKPAERKPEDKAKEEKPKESKGSVTIAGQEINYVAKAGLLPLLKEDGSGERAKVFYVYYQAVGADGKPLASADPSKRPITFCFNGGPGSSAVWLHFGGLGPRKVEFDAQGLLPALRAPVVANPNSILDVSDLVFIDPVGTGASRPVKGEKSEQFWSVNGDIESIGEFIRSLTTREQRWASPKFLCGESYGGIRGSGLCDFLQSKFGLYVDGFMCVSGVINFENIDGGLESTLAYLPTYTATAHFHHKLPPDLQADRAKAIGLFMENLLRKEAKIIGRFDGRVVSEDFDQLGTRPEFDPSYTNIYGAFAAAANASIRGDLGYEWELPYTILGGVNWSFRDYEGQVVNLEDRLAKAMKQNAKLRVLFCLGYRDLAVPMDSTIYSIDSLRIPDSLRSNLTIQYYESGHMMYLNQPDAEKLRKDMVEFIRGK
jgi:carboxypeptidase C (cathepsin A)